MGFSSLDFELGAVHDSFYPCFGQFIPWRLIIE